MLQNLWAVIDSATFEFRMQCDIFASRNNNGYQKLNLKYSNISRYIFLRGRHDDISHFSYQTFNVKFDKITVK